MSGVAEHTFAVWANYLYQSYLATRALPEFPAYTFAAWANSVFLTHIAPHPFLFFLFRFLCCQISGFFLPFHWAFVFDRVHVKLPYKKFWMRLAFPFELVLLWGILFISKPIRMPFCEPFGLPIFEWFTYFHLLVHTWHTFYVFKWNPPALHIKVPILEEIIGRDWVTCDAIVHTAAVLRLISICNGYEIILTVIHWHSTLRTLDHRFFLEDSAKEQEESVKHPAAKKVI